MLRLKLEPYYCYHDDLDIAVHSKFFSGLAGHLGGESNGKDLYLTAKPKDFQSALFRFFQLAVLVSKLGHDIILPGTERR